MRSQLLQGWHMLTQVSEQRPARVSRRSTIIFSLICITIALSFFFFLGFDPLAKIAQAEKTTIWLAVVVFRALVCIFLGILILSRAPWKETDLLQRRKGRIAIIINLLFLGLVFLLLVLSIDEKFATIAAISYLIEIAVHAQAIWFLRRGYVNYGINITLFNLFLQIIISIREWDYETVSYFFIIVLLMAVLLSRWWAGFLISTLFIVLMLVFSRFGITESPFTLGAAIGYSTLYFFLSGMIGLYAHSLEQSLRDSDMHSDELSQASTILTQQNQQLVQQSAVLHATQDQLQTVIAEQDARIASAIAELRQRSVELRTIQTPLIRVAHDVIVVPLIGEWDAARAQLFIENVLHYIEKQGASFVILDLTGIAAMQREVYQILDDTFHAAKLLGCQLILVGITPAIAKAIVALDLDLSTIATAPDLAEGIRLTQNLQHA